MNILALEMIFAWNIPGLVQSLTVMLKGMVGIFAVILVIWLVIVILNRVTSPKADDGKKE